MLDNITRNEDLLTLTHSNDTPEKFLRSAVPPVFMNSIHVFDTLEGFETTPACNNETFVYGRDGNPTVAVLEKKIAALEHGTRSVVYASGMAALSAAIMATCKAGSHIICMDEAYSSIRDAVSFYADMFGMTATFITCSDLQELEDSIQDNTRLIVLESPASTFLRVVDLRAIAEIAHRKGCRTYIDNSWATPIFQKPLDMGIDIVMHSLSKYIGGHSDIIGGVLTTKDDELNSILVRKIRDKVGGLIGPMEAWLVLRSLRTLDLRMREFERTGIAVAAYLEKHPKVRKVYHTSLDSHPQKELIARQQTGHSSLMGLTLNTDDEATVLKFVDNLKLFSKGPAWGSYSSLVQMPLHRLKKEKLGHLSGDRLVVRLSCGLEGAENIIADLEQALDSI